MNVNPAHGLWPDSPDAPTIQRVRAGQDAQPSARAAPERRFARPVLSRRVGQPVEIGRRGPISAKAVGEASGGAKPQAQPRARPRVLLITEGTYPYAVGGVSSWCHAVLTGLSETDWDVLPILAGRKHQRPTVKLPPNTRLLPSIDLWSESHAPRRLHARRATDHGSLPAELLRGLMPWEGDLEGLTAALVRCRRNPESIRPEFRGRESWEKFVSELEQLLMDSHRDSAPAPIYDAIEAARLYQALYWVARTAAVPTPPCDVIHVTAAGWSGIPAIIHKALYGTPLLLTEHGVYVREAYLASVREAAARPGHGHISPRLALGMTRAVYAAADVIAPVTEANAEWERGLGVDPAKIRVIPNGIDPPKEYTAPPNIKKVIAVGRLDPLKDVQTMLLVASEVTRRLPDARFDCYGPPTLGQEMYADACSVMHRQLGLGDRFRFMGGTRDPYAAIRSGDVVLMTSISEAMPMTLLEAMGQARPIVATSVGGVPSVIRGCGLVAPPGDIHEIATAVVTLLSNPALGARLGRRGYERVHRKYTLSRCLSAYDELIRELAGTVAA
jgi:polysaccharide biosynthesis protein PelF